MQSNLRIEMPGIALLIIGLPLAIQPENTNSSLEAALLIIALAAQAEGKRDRALVLAAASCFVKPTMGYVYGFLLILLAGLELSRRSTFTLENIFKALGPAAAASAALALLLASVFGVSAVASTLLPLRGMEAYRALHFGLFNGSVGRFLYFPGVHFGYYLGTPALFWLAGTLWLGVSGIKAGIAQLSGCRFTSRLSHRPRDRVYLRRAASGLRFGLLWASVQLDVLSIHSRDRIVGRGLLVTHLVRCNRCTSLAGFGRELDRHSRLLPGMDLDQSHRRDRIPVVLASRTTRMADFAEAR